MNKYINNLNIFIIALFTIIFSSCGSTKNVPYFQDVSVEDKSNLSYASIYEEPVIQQDDILSISLFTIDPMTSMVINQVATQAISAGSSKIQGSNISATQSTSGFLVDRNGEIELSVIGKVKVVGLTTAEATNLIREKASLSYNNPNVQVRFANFKITILGEVGQPATYTIPNEKVSVLDAIGLAGDLTIFGKRENILLIRDNNGNKEFARLNLNSAKLFASEYFYLKQNDVLYIEPNKGKAASLNQARTQTFAIIGTALSVLIVLLSRI